MNPSDRETSARQTSESTGTEEFEVLALGLFSRTAVSAEYRPGCSFREPSAEALIDQAWQTYLRTSSEAGIIVYNGALFRLDSFERRDDHLRIELSDTDFRECIGTASAEFRSAFPNLPQANPLAASVALVTDDGKIIIEREEPYRLTPPRVPRHRGLHGAGEGRQAAAPFRYPRKGGRRGVGRGPSTRLISVLPGSSVLCMARSSASAAV